MEKESVSRVHGEQEETMEVQIIRSYDVYWLRSNATTDWNLSHTRLQQLRKSNERHPRNCEVRGFRVVMGDKARNIIVEYTMAKSPPCVLAFLATALHLIAILTVKVAIPINTDSNNAGILLFLRFLLWWCIIDDQPSKGVSADIENGMNIGRKDIAIGVQMYHGTHLEGRN